MRLIFVFSLLLTIGCSTESTQQKEKDPNLSEQITDQKVAKSYKVIFTEEVGWGYQIFDGNKLMINQKHIPAVQGLKGFETKEKAEKTAQFVLDQVEAGIFPPTITTEILDSLGVL